MLQNGVAEHALFCMLLNGVDWYSSNQLHCAQFLLNYSTNVLWYIKLESSYYPQQPATRPHAQPTEFNPQSVALIHLDPI